MPSKPPVETLGIGGPLFDRLYWRLIVVGAALREGWPITRRGRSWWAGATGKVR